MDPHWNAAYGRLPHGASIPNSTNPLSRYDLLEQSALSGLGLSPPLPAHSSHPQARGFGGIPSYGHHIPPPVGHHQLLDSAFAQGFVGQSPYKAVPVGQPGYALDTTRSLSDHTGRASSSSIQMSKPVFKESFPSSSSALTQASETPKGWSLSNFLPQPSNPFSLSTDFLPTGYPNVNPPPPVHPAAGMLKQSGSQPTILHISDATLLSYADTLIAQSKVHNEEPPDSHHQVKGGFIEQSSNKSGYDNDNRPTQTHTHDNQGQSRAQFSVKGSSMGDQSYSRVDSIYSKSTYLEKQLQHELYVGRERKESFVQQHGQGQSSYPDYKPNFSDTYSNPIKEYAVSSPSLPASQSSSLYVNAEGRSRSSSFSDPNKRSGLNESPSSNTAYSDPVRRYHSGYNIGSADSGYNSFSPSSSGYSSSVITSSMNDRYESVSPPSRPVTESPSADRQSQYNTSNNEHTMLQQPQTPVTRTIQDQPENLVMQSSQHRQAMVFNQVLQASVITEGKRSSMNPSSLIQTPVSHISAPSVHSPQRSASSHGSPLDLGSPATIKQSHQKHYPRKDINVESSSIIQHQNQQKQKNYPTAKDAPSSTVVQQQQQQTVEPSTVIQQQQSAVPIQAVPDSTTSKLAAKPKRSRKKKTAPAASESKGCVPVQPVAPMPAMIQPVARGQDMVQPGTRGQDMLHPGARGQDMVVRGHNRVNRGQDMVPLPPIQQIRDEGTQVIVEPLNQQGAPPAQVQIHHQPSHPGASIEAQSTIDMQAFASLQSPHSEPQQNLGVPASQEFGSTSEAMAMYMTSSFGTGFVNPNDILAENMPLVVQNDPQIMSDEGQGSMMNMDPQLGYGAAAGAVRMAGSKRKPSKTKAEKKLMPTVTTTTSQVCNDDGFDDEFAHLKTDPMRSGGFTAAQNIRSTGNLNEIVPNVNTDISSSHIVPTPPKIAKMPQTAFQDSFLGFLQGKKPETLSSVTTSTTGKKPQLPKYIPMETPRPQPQVPKKKKASMDSGDGLAFSDADDSSQDSSTGLFQAVQTAISNISDSDSKDDRAESDKPGIDPFKGSILKQIKQQRTKRRKKKQKEKTFSSDVVMVVSGDEEDVMAMEPIREPSPPPRRESLKRSAKVKLEEKRKKRHEKSSKRKKTGSHIDISDASEDDFIAISSEEEGYDSDKDPGWAPGGGETVPKYGSDSDDDVRDRKRGKRGKGRGLPFRPRVHPGSDLWKQNQDKMIDISENEESADNLVHNYEKGEFVINKKDLTNLKNYPIWKIDSNKLLQKYEAIEDHGKLVHKAISTYSSWSDGARSHYKPIEVNFLSQGKGYEMVEVLEKFKPKESALSTVVNEEDPFLENFNTYLQILLSQALEENFISAMIEENDPFYLDPLNSIDDMLEERKELVRPLLSWKETFKGKVRVNNFVLGMFQRAVEEQPYLSFTDTQAKGQHCQACENLQTPAVKMVELYGGLYHRKTLQVIQNSTKHKEFYIGEQASKCLYVYHGLHHFKFALYKRCAAKIQLIRDTNSELLEGAEVLDQLLMNRTWVLQLYTDLKRLLGDANVAHCGTR